VYNYYCCCCLNLVYKPIGITNQPYNKTKDEEEEEEAAGSIV
jgi:hypothetical protein